MWPKKWIKSSPDFEGPEKMKRSKENRKKHNRGSRKNRTKTLKQKKTTLNKTVTRKDSNETQSEKNKLSVDCQWTILSTKLTKPSTIPDSDVLKKTSDINKSKLDQHLQYHYLDKK